MTRSFVIFASVLILAGCGRAAPSVEATAPAAESVPVSIHTAAAVERDVANRHSRRPAPSWPTNPPTSRRSVSGSVVDDAGQRRRRRQAPGRCIVRLDRRNANLELGTRKRRFNRPWPQAENAKVEAERHAALVKSGRHLAEQLRKAHDAARRRRRRRRAGGRPGREREKGGPTTRPSPRRSRARDGAPGLGRRVRDDRHQGGHHRAHPADQARAAGPRVRRRRSCVAACRFGAEVPAHPGIDVRGCRVGPERRDRSVSRAMAIEVRFPNADAPADAGHVRHRARSSLPATERGLFVPAVGDRPDRERRVVRRLRHRRRRRRGCASSRSANAHDGMVRILAGLEGRRRWPRAPSISCSTAPRVRADSPAARRARNDATR